MKKSLSKDKVIVKDEALEQLIERMNRIEDSQRAVQSEILGELNKIYEFEKSAIVQIANSINKMSEKINALTIELEDKNNELNEYRNGFGFRISKATFLELVKLKQFVKQDQNQNYSGVIDEIFDLNEICQIEAYEGMKFDAKKHFIKGIQKTTNEHEDDTIYKVSTDGYYVMDNTQNIKVFKYAEVIIYKWEER